MVAESDGKLAGMIELRGDNHISMLYVDKAFHRQGIAEELVKNALREVSAGKQISDDITVNSSRYAVPFYESLGFIQYEEEKSVYGVIHTPMLLFRSDIKELTE